MKHTLDVTKICLHKFSITLLQNKSLNLRYTYIDMLNIGILRVSSIASLELKILACMVHSLV